MNLGLVNDPIFMEHDAGRFHCETPERLSAINQALGAWAGMHNCCRLPLRSASGDEIIRVHTPTHLARIAATSGKSMALDADTGASPRSYEVARLAAGSLVDLCDKVLHGELNKGVALVRPPGHHATRDRAMGFCLFNNVAVAAAHLVEERGLDKVLIVDWDVHHGNGTEDIFFADKRVLYFSVHQSPLYPGTGPADAVGSGGGEGYTVNCPMKAGMTDLDYIRVFEDLLRPVALAYNPQFILISAGFDAHREDPLGSMFLSSDGYDALTQIVREIAEECCQGRIVASLEGGYALAAQARAMVAVLNALMGGGHEDLRVSANRRNQTQALRRAMEVQARYWPVHLI